MTAHNDLLDNRNLRRDEVLQLAGFSKVTLRNRVAAGRFPEPMRLSKRMLVWRAPDVLEYLRDPATWAPAQKGA